MNKSIVAIIIISLIYISTENKTIVMPLSQLFDIKGNSEEEVLESIDILGYTVPLGSPNMDTVYNLKLTSDLYYTYLALENSTKKQIKPYNCSDPEICRPGKDLDAHVENLEDDNVKNGTFGNLVSEYGKKTSKSEKLINNNLYLLFATELYESNNLYNATGKLGLDLYKVNETFNGSNFIKHNDLNIKNWTFFLDMDSDNKLTDLVIGTFPYEYDSERYKKDDFVQSPVYKDDLGRKRFCFAINQATYGDKRPEKRNHIIKNGIINFEGGMLTAPKSFRDLVYKEFFSQYINSKKCREIPMKNFTYFVCDSDVDTNKMQTIYITNDYSGNKYQFTPSELFYEYQGKKYYRIKFKTVSTEFDNWILGEPFFKKYKMVFDYKNEVIYIHKCSQSVEHLKHN